MDNANDKMQYYLCNNSTQMTRMLRMNADSNLPRLPIN
jgi:hypothetical protein